MLDKDWLGGYQVVTVLGFSIDRDNQFVNTTYPNGKKVLNSSPWQLDMRDVYTTWFTSEDAVKIYIDKMRDENGVEH